MQNNMMRYLTGSLISDKGNIKQFYKETNTLSVNQINAQIKLSEVWKAVNVINYPIKLTKKVASTNKITTCAVTNGELCEKGKKDITQNTYINDAVRLLNQAPSELQEANSLYSQKAHKIICKNSAYMMPSS